MPDPIKITVENVVSTIRHISPLHFNAFHLSPCHCGLPTWQQPCPFCGYYPQYGHTGTNVKQGEYIGKRGTFLRGRSIFAVYCDSLCRSPVASHNADIQAIKRTHDDKYEWPTGIEIFHAFAKPDRDKALSDKYNLTNWIETDPMAYWTYQLQLAKARHGRWLYRIDYGMGDSYAKQELRHEQENVERAKNKVAELTANG